MNEEWGRSENIDCLDIEGSKKSRLWLPIDGPLYYHAFHLAGIVAYHFVECCFHSFLVDCRKFQTESFQKVSALSVVIDLGYSAYSFLLAYSSIITMVGDHCYCSYYAHHLQLILRCIKVYTVTGIFHALFLFSLSVWMAPSQWPGYISIALDMK